MARQIFTSTNTSYLYTKLQNKLFVTIRAFYSKFNNIFRFWSTIYANASHLNWKRSAIPPENIFISLAKLHQPTIS